jgi:hypothetical protein
MSLLQVDKIASRRRLLQFLAASPLFANAVAPAFAQSTSAPSRLPDPMSWAPRELDNLISDPKDALDVFDFEPVAKKNLPPAHFGYMVTGIDDEVTLRANREGFLKFQLRPRRLVDVSAIDMAVEILGATYDSPIVIAPTGSNRAFDPEGELAVAKSAKTGNHLQILSSGATTSIEEAIAARRCGSSCTCGSGRLPKRLSDAQNEPAPPWWSSPSMAVRSQIGKLFFGCGALIRGGAMAAMAEVLRTMSPEDPTTKELTSATPPA